MSLSDANRVLLIACTDAGILSECFSLIGRSSSKRLPFARFYMDLVRMIIARFSNIDQEKLMATLNTLLGSLDKHKAKCTINDALLFICSTSATIGYYRVLTGEEHPFLQVSYRMRELILYVYSLNGKSQMHAVRLLCGLIRLLKKRKIFEDEVENVFNIIFVKI